MNSGDNGGDEGEKAAELNDFLDFKDAMVYLIDVSATMLTEPNVEPYRSPVYLALLGAYMAITDRLMFSPLDMCGVILYGVENGNLEKGPKHVYELMPLGLPDSTSLKELKNLLQDEDEFEKIVRPLEKKSEGPSMADVLFLANQKFSYRAPRYFSRRLIIVTDEDTPYTDKESLKAAKTRAADLVQLNVRIKPLLVESVKDKPFSTGKFYDELTLVPEYIAHEFDDVDDELSTIPVEDIIQECSLTSRGVRRKAEFTTNVELSPDLKFGVKGYLMFLHRKPQRSYWVYNKAEESKLVKTEMKPMNKDSGRVLDRDEVMKGYRFGKRLITFSEEQYEQIRQIDDPVIRIIGFKPLAAIKPRYNLTHARFIYPSELKLSGSTRAFSCLHKSMIKKNRVAIAWCVLRANNTPRLYALIPSEEEYKDMEKGPYSGKRVQYKPDGFFMIQLPFRDDIREPPIRTQIPEPQPELVEASSNIIQSVRMAEGYTPERYVNKYLEDFNKILQAKALEEAMPEELMKDSTVPSYKSINKRAGGEIAEWNRILSELVPANKHKRPSEQPSDSSSKQSKTAATGSNQADIIEAARNQTLGKFKVNELKAFASSVGITASRKNQLIDEIQRYVGSM